MSKDCSRSNNCVSSSSSSSSPSTSKFNNHFEHQQQQTTTLASSGSSSYANNNGFGKSCIDRRDEGVVREGLRVHNNIIKVNFDGITNNTTTTHGRGGGESRRRHDDDGGVGGDKEEIGFCKLLEAQLFHLGNRKTWFGIFLGQLCSGFLCLTAITNVYLIDVHLVHLPNAQNFAFYLLLSLVFTSLLAFRRGERNLFPVLRLRGWKYALVALVDVEGSFLLLKAYQFTTITSVQLLDCFSIPTVLSFSWLILRVRFRVPHILGVSICLLGISCLVWADIESDGKYMGNRTGRDRFVGDMFCLSGAFLYGVSGVAQEFIVKTFDVIEFLGMIGLLGSFISGIQTIILEYSNVVDSNWNSQIILLISIYGFGQFSLHCLAACLIKISSITALCISLLSADFYVVMLGLQLFQYKFHPLYFLSFIFVICGVIIFSIKPTTTMPHLYRSLVREQMTITTDLELLASASSPLDPSKSNIDTNTNTTTSSTRIMTSGHSFDNNYEYNHQDPDDDDNDNASPLKNHSTTNHIITSTTTCNNSRSASNHSLSMDLDSNKQMSSPHYNTIENNRSNNSHHGVSFTYAIPEDEIC